MTSRSCSRRVWQAVPERCKYEIRRTSMPKNFIQKAFGRWLSRNRGRFRFQPVIVKKRKDSIIGLRFMGISQKIGCVITRHCADIYVSHQGECWDILIDLGAVERKSSAGYYCELCEPDKREFFATREE